MWKFQGSIKKEVEILGLIEKKTMWNFHGPWFLTLDFPRGVSQNFAEFAGVVKACFLWKACFFFQKSIALSPRSIFFWNNPIWNVEHVYYITMYFLFNFAWYSIQLDIVCWFLLNRQNLLTKSVKLDKSYLLRIPNKVGVCMSQWKTENWSQESFF